MKESIKAICFLAFINFYISTAKLFIKSPESLSRSGSIISGNSKSDQ